LLFCFFSSTSFYSASSPLLGAAGIHKEKERKWEVASTDKRGRSINVQGGFWRAPPSSVMGDR